MLICIARIVAPRSFFVPALFGGLMLAGFAQADTVWVRSGAAGKELDFPNVKVTKVQGGDLYFSSEASGRETRRSLDQVTRISLDDDAPFTAAEAAYAQGDLKSSIDGYSKSLNSSSRDWVKTRASLRLLEAGNKTGNLQAAVGGLVSLSRIDPTLAESHPATIPPNAAKADLDAAITTVKTASGASGLTPEQQKPLLALLQQLYTANKDTASAGKVLEKLEGVASAAAANGGTAQDASDANRVKAQVKLNDARAALAAKNYQGTISAIQENSALFADPASQNEALYLLAEGKAATAGSDKGAMMDAAIAYIRVAANFGNQPNAPHVSESLLKAAAIEEKLKPEEALVLYKQIASEYKDSAAGKTAADSVDRLAKK